MVPWQLDLAHQQAIDRNPEFANAHNHYEWALAQTGRMDEALEQLKEAVALVLGSVEFQFNLASVLELRGDSAAAIPAFQKAVDLSRGKDWRCFSGLAEAYSKAGRSGDAVKSAQQALDVATQQHDADAAENLRAALERYEREAAVAGTNDGF